MLWNTKHNLKVSHKNNCAICSKSDKKSYIISSKCLKYIKLNKKSASFKIADAMTELKSLDNTINNMCLKLHAIKDGYVPDKKDIKLLRDDLYFLISISNWSYKQYNKYKEIAEIESSMYLLNQEISKQTALTTNQAIEMFNIPRHKINKYKIPLTKGKKLLYYTDLVYLINH